jgi:AcrR family transcriptional regulator
MPQKNATSEKMKAYMAESLLFLMKEKPYSAITIGEITSKAGVNRATYYRNFKSKEDIVRFYYNKILFRHRENAGKNETLKKHFLKMFRHYFKYKEELLLLHRNGLSHLLLDALNALYAAIAGEHSLQEKCMIYQHTGAVYNGFLLWFSDNMNESPDSMSEMYAAITPQDYEALFPC